MLHGIRAGLTGFAIVLVGCLAAPAQVFDMDRLRGEIGEILEQVELPIDPGVLMRGHVDSNCDDCPDEMYIDGCACDHPHQALAAGGPVWEASGYQEQLGEAYRRYQLLQVEIRKKRPRAGVRVTSAFRDPEYQGHLYSIYATRQYRGALSRACHEPCSEVLSLAEEECRCHGICANPVARNSSHSSGDSFDVAKDSVGGLTDCELCRIARKVGLSLLVECRAYHFTVSDQPKCARKCKGPFVALPCGDTSLVATQVSPNDPDLQCEEVEAFVPPTWDIEVGGLSLKTVFPSLLSIKGILPSEPGPTNGFGATLDLPGGTPLQLMGAATIEGASRYVFSEPLTLRWGVTQSFRGLTYTDVPPLHPAALHVTPTSLRLRLNERATLAVVAELDDGSEIDVTPREWRSIYRSDNAEVARIADNGIVTALAPGRTQLHIVNGQASASVTIVVDP